ncbi:helix-turn-helix domain-containing protein [Metabacillus idriensis]|uniref:helix-turn-helix domain-containing protein n=1 Tax=Metabacillus idriensis TaxID=324768 RepID=UPI0039901C16
MEINSAGLREQLAERMNVSRPVITRLETGEQAPELSYLISLSNTFNVSIDHLLGRIEKSRGLRPL